MAADKGNKELFENMPVSKALWTLCVPTVISQLIVLIYSLADTFYVGRTNNPYMVAAASLILPVYNISISLAGIAGVGGGSLISRHLGAGKYEDAKKVCSFSFWFTIGIASLFSVFTLLFMRPLLHALGAGSETYDFARGYATCVIVCGGIPTVLGVALANILRSVGMSKQAGFGVSMGGIINIILDPLFMFVLFPKGMEIIGAGVATMLSNVIVCMFFAFILHRNAGKTVLAFSPKLAHPAGADIRSVFTVGLPSAITTLLFDLDYVVIGRLMSGYGDIPLASIGIVLKAERFPLNVGLGICLGMVPLVAYNYSSGNLKRMKETVRLSRLTGLCIGLTSLAVYELLAGGIMHIFIDDAQTVYLGTQFLRIRSLATTFMFLCFHVVYLFNGMGKGKSALTMGVTRWAVINIPMLFIMHALFGMYGIVWSQLVSDVIMATISILYFRSCEKKLGITV